MPLICVAAWTCLWLPLFLCFILDFLFQPRPRLRPSVSLIRTMVWERGWMHVLGINSNPGFTVHSFVRVWGYGREKFHFSLRPWPREWFKPTKFWYEVQFSDGSNRSDEFQWSERGLDHWPSPLFYFSRSPSIGTDTWIRATRGCWHTAILFNSCYGSGTLLSGETSFLLGIPFEGLVCVSVCIDPLGW